jgi:hypothetical protein
VVPEYRRGDCCQTNDRSSLNKRKSKSSCFIHNSHGWFEFSAITHPSGSSTHVGHVTNGYVAVKANCARHNIIISRSKGSTLCLYRRLGPPNLPEPDCVFTVACSCSCSVVGVRLCLRTTATSVAKSVRSNFIYKSQVLSTCVSESRLGDQSSVPPEPPS